MTETMLRHILNDLHAHGLSWRRISCTKFPSVPAGTLYDIAHGKHVPARYREYFHIRRRASKPRDPALLPISQRPTDVLRWQLLNREAL